MASPSSSSSPPPPPNTDSITDEDNLLLGRPAATRWTTALRHQLAWLSPTSWRSVAAFRQVDLRPLYRSAILGLFALVAPVGYRTSVGAARSEAIRVVAAASRILTILLAPRVGWHRDRRRHGRAHARAAVQGPDAGARLPLPHETIRQGVFGARDPGRSGLPHRSIRRVPASRHRRIPRRRRLRQIHHTDTDNPPFSFFPAPTSSTRPTPNPPRCWHNPAATWWWSSRPSPSDSWTRCPCRKSGASCAKWRRGTALANGNVWWDTPWGPCGAPNWRGP